MPATLLLALALQSAPQPLTTIQEKIQSGDLGSAETLLATAFAAKPNDPGLLNLRGIIHAQRHELADAHADFAAAVHLSPTLTPAWRNLGRACQLEDNNNQIPCAVDAWQHVLRAKPSDPEARASLAALYARQNKFTDALRELDKIPPQANNASTLITRLSALNSLNREAEAKTVATRLAARPDFSIDDFESLSSSPSSVIVALGEGLDSRHAATPDVLRRMVIAYENTQRLAEARKTLERVAVADAQNPAHLLELARLAELAKDHEGALSYLAHARDLEPNNAQIHYLWGVIAAEMDLPVEARRSLDKALELDPNKPLYNYAMGSVILSTRDAATAAGYFEKFVKSNPKDARGHYALGIAYFASGDYERAKAEMQAVSIEKNTAPGAEYFLGRMARLDGDFLVATHHLEKSIHLAPAYAEPHTELGRVYMLQGNTEQARTELLRALKLDPNSFQANDQLLVLYKKTHDARAAQQAELVKKLDEERSRRAELMLRTIEAKPF